MIVYQIDHWNKYHLLEEKRADKTLCGLSIPQGYPRIEVNLRRSRYMTALCQVCLKERMKGR